MRSGLGFAACFLFVAGCGGVFQTQYKTGFDAQATNDWRVESISVIVPNMLTVSESNSIAANADILWQGEPFGDRKKQVATIIEDAAKHASSQMNGSRPVSLAIVVERFHAVSNKARKVLSVSGVHSIRFTAQAIDATTGKPIANPSKIAASLPAFTGKQAQIADQLGETQKVRISRHLKSVFLAWLGQGPDVRRTFIRFGL